MKKILYILEDGRFGGMNKMTADIAKNIQANDFNTHLLVGKQNSDFFVQYLNLNKIPYSLVSQSILSKKISSLIQYSFNFVSDIFSIFRVIKESKPHLVYCNGSQQIKGVIAASLSGKKVIWHMHDTYQPLPLLILFKIVKALCRVKWFVASCQRTIDFYGLDISKIHISRPPIDTASFHTFEKGLINLNTPIKVLTISNINSDKGLDTLIKVAAELNKKPYLFIFTVVGLGADNTNNTYRDLCQLMKSLNVSNVEFVGQKTNIKSILSKADLYLCTSRNESGPISVFEALAMKVPVVSTDIGDLGLLFTKYNYGPVFPVGDYVALANELYSIVNQSEKRSVRTLTGRKLAEQELDIAICANRQREFYKKVFSI